MNNTKTPIIIAVALAIAGIVGGAYLAFQSQPTPQPPVSESPPPEVSEPIPADPTPNDSTPTAPASPPPRSQPMQVPSPSPTPQPTSPIAIAPPQDNCEITSAIVSDPNPPTNVRSTPQVAPNNIVGTVDNGTYLSVVEERNGWFKINNPVEGWVSKTVTESSCSIVSERIAFPVNGNSAIVQGQIIGGGTHKYILNAREGQTMAIRVTEGPLPFVFPPNDPNQNNDLTDGGNYSDKQSWTGTLPATGDYTLVLDSNFRGYEYEFLVEIK